MNFEEHSSSDLLKSAEGEIAKALSEIRHAQDDIEKADNRLRFALAIVHSMKDKDMKI